MKKSIFHLTILAGMLSFSLSSNAQQARQTANSPKPPEVKGKILQSDQAAANPVVSPATVAEKSLPTATDIKPSQSMLKITKTNDQQQAKAGQSNPQPSTATMPPPVDHPTLLKNQQTEIPGSKISPVSNRIKE